MFTLDDDIMRQLRAAFKTECEEHVQAMNKALLELEKGPDEARKAEVIKDMFREAHSVKGAAGAADMGEVESTGHRLESILDSVRSGKLALSPELFDILYEAIDTVSLITEAVLNNTDHGLDLELLWERLDAAKQGQLILKPQPQVAADPEPQSAPQPVVVAATAPLSGSAQAAPAPIPASASAPAAAPAAAAAAPVDDSKQPTRKAAQRSGAGRVEVDETIRVSTNKLDDLMTQAGELLVAGLKIDQRVREVTHMSRVLEEWHREWLKMRASLGQMLHAEGQEQMRPLLRFVDTSQQRLRDVSAEMMDLRRGFAQDAIHLDRVTSDLEESVMRVRMLPVSTVFDAFPRMVRDLCRDLGKKAELELAGAETELDRKVLEQIKDPLVHVLRNAIDHGIELPELREQRGKNPTGSVTLSAYQKGNHIVIQVSDDGGGIDVGKVKRSALRNGVITAEEAESMSDAEAMRLIFASGLSTSDIITDVSGRGVGMDVVRQNIEDLHGQVDIQSELGQGTSISLSLPLTLATTQELLVKVREQTFGIPISAVERIQRITSADVSTVEGKEVILVDEEPVTLVRLCQVLEIDDLAEENVRADQKVPVVILQAGWKRIAFQVDAVVGQQESVVKSLGKQLRRVRNVAGATILGTGQIIMSLNPLDMVKGARQIVSGTQARRVERHETHEDKTKHVLVVDDSLTTRNLEKTILETAGYVVNVAINGAEALEILRSTACDVVVSDVLMPELDGFGLTESIRQDPRLADLPVILVTSLDSREDRDRGVEAGANAYIVKSAFEQESLLDAIERLAS